MFYVYSMREKMIGIFFIMLFLSGCGQIQSSVSVKASTPGVSKDEIILGSSSALTGQNNYLGNNYNHGAQAYFNYINEKGGIYGRSIRLYSYDDQYDPNKCVSNTQKLINYIKVFSLFNYVGTPTTVKVLPLIDEERIPLVGVFSGAQVLRWPVNNYVFNIRASYYEELEKTVDHIYHDLNIHKFAIFYQNDAYGNDGLKGAELALKKIGLKPTQKSYYIRGTMEVETAAKQIIESSSDAILMIGTYSPSAKLVKLIKQAGKKPLFYSVSFGGPEKIISELEEYGDGVVVSQVMPLQELDSGHQVDQEKDFTSIFNKYYPQEQANMIAFEGFINAQVFVYALYSAGPELTRERFINSLNTLSNYKMHEHGSTIKFSTTNHQGMNEVYFSYIENGKFKTLSSWDNLKNFIVIKN
jgi:branched-chain amino acid transport system substrate-binding protein